MYINILLRKKLVLAISHIRLQQFIISGRFGQIVSVLSSANRGLDVQLNFLLLSSVHVIGFHVQKVFSRICELRGATAEGIAVCKRTSLSQLGIPRYKTGELQVQICIPAFLSRLKHLSYHSHCSMYTLFVSYLLFLNLSLAFRSL